MAARVRVVLNKSEVRKLLRGEGKYEGVRADLMRRAEAIAAEAGPGMETELFIENDRARAGIVTATADAMVAEARNRSLSRALDAGR